MVVLYKLTGQLSFERELTSLVNMKLTKGDKQYLKGHGISEAGFEKMPEQDKREWKEECEEKNYRDSWLRKDAVGQKVMGGPVKVSPDLEGKETVSEFKERMTKKKNKNNNDINDIVLGLADSFNKS